jgi:hypothetical protein
MCYRTRGWQVYISSMTTSQCFESGDTRNTGLESLLNEHQYSAITGESVATARRNRTLRRGCPYVKLGALVRYRPEDVRSYISQNVQNTQQEGK